MAIENKGKKRKRIASKASQRRNDKVKTMEAQEPSNGGDVDPRTLVAGVTAPPITISMKWLQTMLKETGNQETSIITVTMGPLHAAFSRQAAKNEVPWDQSKFEQLLVQWQVACDQPFDEVEKPKFKALMHHTTIPQHRCISPVLLQSSGV
ncbi:hypothetical protein JB92DRAFT_2832872 [Gautieria morchelliformis]|nr:hypothetical protein JB92DRAFT_2832872 [Gautieria morchelliformis]